MRQSASMMFIKAMLMEGPFLTLLPRGIVHNEAMAFWVYMLECADGSSYVGHSDDLEKRMAGHVSGALGGYTATRRPVGRVFTPDCSSRDAAWSAERQINGWSRTKKQALIGGDWAEWL